MENLNKQYEIYNLSKLIKFKNKKMSLASKI